jgi:cytochrome oxidase assembly protein ShyY1
LPDDVDGGVRRSIRGDIDECRALASRAVRRAHALLAWPKVTSFPHERARALGKTAAIPSLLDADAEGFVREWSPPGMPPERHFSYAIQWWGFAGVLLVLYFGLNFRKVS